MESDGGPVFPCSVETINPLNGAIYPAQHNGISLRDWFAGRALTGVISNAHTFETRDAAHVAELAYLAADAMLKARANAAPR